MNRERPGSGAADAGDAADGQEGPEAPVSNKIPILGQVADSCVLDLLPEQAVDVLDAPEPVVVEQAWEEDAEDLFGLGGDLD